MVNVTIYGIHGSYGNVVSSAPPSHFYGMDDHAGYCVSDVLAARRMGARLPEKLVDLVPVDG